MNATGRALLTAAADVETDGLTGLGENAEGRSGVRECVGLRVRVDCPATGDKLLNNEGYRSLGWVMQKVCVFPDRDGGALDDAIHDVFFHSGSNMCAATIELTDPLVVTETVLRLVIGLCRVGTFLREDAAVTIDVDLGQFGGLRWTDNLRSVDGLCKDRCGKEEKHNTENRTWHRGNLLTS